MRPITSFSRTAKLSPSTATRPPKRLVTPWTSSTVFSGMARFAAGAPQGRFDPADHSVRDQVHDEQERYAEQQNRLARKPRGDQLPQHGGRNHAEQRPPGPGGAPE